MPGSWFAVTVHRTHQTAHRVVSAFQMQACRQQAGEPSSHLAPSLCRDPTYILKLHRLIRGTEYWGEFWFPFLGERSQEVGQQTGTRVQSLAQYVSLRALPIDVVSVIARLLPAHSHCLASDWALGSWWRPVWAPRGSGCQPQMFCFSRLPLYNPSLPFPELLLHSENSYCPSSLILDGTSSGKPSLASSDPP